MTVDKVNGSFGGRLRGVDDLDAGGHGTLEEGPQQRVVRAAQDQRVWVKSVVGSFGEEFIEIDVDHLGGDGVVWSSPLRPAGRAAGRLSRWRAGPGRSSGGIGVALHGGVGGDDQYVAGMGSGAGGGRAGLDDAEHGNGNRVLNGVESQGAGGIAGDDEELGALFFDQELRALRRIAGDGAAGFGAIGQTGRVADESEAGVRQACDQGAQDGEPAEAGIEDADGGRGGLRTTHGVAPCGVSELAAAVGTASAVR